VDEAEERIFRDFVAARSPALLRSAYLLTGDRDRAEDLLQTALTKTYVAWPRIRDVASIEGYVRRTMTTTATSWWRRHRERPSAALPERGVDQLGNQLERDALWEHVRALPAKQRAVLVLRYYEGLSEGEIAELMRISRGTVKSHTSRALAALRRRLEEESTEGAMTP